MLKYLIPLFMSILLTSSLCVASNDTDIQNAKKFMNDEMYPQAIALWEKVIEEHPEDAAVHFQIGICHLNLYDYENADDSFAEAIRLQLDYAYKVSDEYIKVACKALFEGKIAVAFDGYKKATQYQPDKDVGIDNLCGVEIKEKTEQIKALSDEAEKHIREKLDQIAKAIEDIKAKMAQEMNSTLLEENAAETPEVKQPVDDDEEGVNRQTETIDIYRVEIAYKVQQNWNYSNEIVGKDTDIQTLLIFKVFPDGIIKDLRFTKRSGNEQFDKTAYQAIMKTNPFDPHPRSVDVPFVHVGLRFTPEGIQ